MAVSINEIARLAGVSAATVSRTFREPDLLSHTTRRRVLDVAERLNYHPRRHASRTPASKSGKKPVQVDSLGLLYFSSDHELAHLNDFYAPIVMGAQSEAAAREMHLILSSASRFVRPAEMPKMFRGQSIAGAILMGAALPDVMQVYTPHLPVSVLVDNTDPQGRQDCILSDGFSGILAATNYLIRIGHRRIAFLRNESTAPSLLERQRGYVCALQEAGIVPSPDWIVVTAAQNEPLDPYIQSLRELPDLPTALVCATDRSAIAAITACRALGLAVPDDLSILGFDNTAVSEHTYPKLTTVHLDKVHMGRLAVRTLLHRIEEAASGEEPLPPAHCVLPTSLVLRDSCAPPK